MKRPQWQSQGENPDYRFSLANERTYLAWIRTALALLASGILLDQLATSYPPAFVTFASVLLVLVAAFCTVTAYFRWRANEIAMRHKQALPHSYQLWVIGIFLAALSLCAGLLILD